MNKQFITSSVCQKEGRHSLCVDYRELNCRTVPDRQPIPRVQETLGNFG